MAQILDLSKRFTQEQIESASQNMGSSFDLPAGGYICKIVEPILNDDPNAGKANIELHVDIAEGDHAGYFQQLEDRFGFWGLRGWMSFKESQLQQFQGTCMALCNSNPGLRFNPLAPGGADVDDLKDKMIGAVIGKEEYKSNSGEIKEKNVIVRFLEVDKIRSKKFKVPETKKLKKSDFDPGFIPVSDSTEIPF